MAWGRNRRAAKRIARSFTVRAVKEKGEKMGLTDDEIGQLERDAHNSFNTKPVARIKLRNLSAEYGGMWGKLGVTVGTVVTQVGGPIGIAVGAAIIGTGLAHEAAAIQHADKLQREETAKERSRTFINFVIDDTEKIDLPPTGDYDVDEGGTELVEKSWINNFLGGLYISFFAKQAEEDVYYYQTKEYTESMEELRQIAQERGVSMAYLREEYRREHGTLDGTIFDYTIKV